MTLWHRGERVTRAVFPCGCALSLMAGHGDRTIESVIVGRRGHARRIRRARRAPGLYPAIVQLGGRALTIDLELLRNAARSSEELWTALLQQERALFHQVHQKGGLQHHACA